MTVKNTEIKRQMLLNSPVPVLPAGLNRLLRSFEEDNITHLKLAKIITDFPSIAARLIFLANSAWAAPRIPVENLETACARLGFSMVRSVSISLCIVSPFEALNRCPAFAIESFWCSSLLTAEGATLLATGTKQVQDVNSSTLHTAGLLHNLGLLWLASHWPEQTSKALELAAADDTLSSAETLRAELGIDYYEAGGMLGRAWKFPDVLVSAMEQHGPDHYPKSDYSSTHLVGYAAEMIKALKLGLDQRPQFPKQIPITFIPGHLDNSYQQLDAQFSKTRELARAMFSPP